MTDPRSRAEAKTANTKYYVTGKPCSRGHVARRYTVSGSCSVCLSENAGRTETPIFRDDSNRRDLTTIWLRIYDSDWKLVNETARELCRAKYPGASFREAPWPKDRAAGTAMYPVTVPPEYDGMMRELADNLRRTHRIDVQAARERILGAVLALAD